MRLVLLFLVAANLIFFAVHQGYLGTLLPDEREPQRLAQQIKPELMRLKDEQAKPAPQVAAKSVDKPTEKSAEKSADKPATDLPASPAPVTDSKQASALSQTTCLEYGSFTLDESKTVISALTTQLPNAKIATRSASEVTGYIVYLPPYPTRDDAVKAVEELKQLGIKDYFIIEDNSSLRFGISLASLRTEDQAKAQLATLTKKGVKNAQINPRTSNRVWLQLRDADVTRVNAKLTELKGKYPNQEVKVCTISN